MNDQFTIINNKINQFIENSTYNKLRSIPSNDLFFYIIIIITIIIFIKQLSITINLIFAIIIGLIVVYLLYDKQKLEIGTFDDQIEIKRLSIEPIPKMFKGHTQLIELVYSFRELYEYNPDAFKKMISNIDSFLILYNDINIGIDYCEYSLETAIYLKKEAINNLFSIIYTLKDNTILENKLKNGAIELHRILKQYLITMQKQCYNKIKKNGLTVKNKLISLNGPKEFNYFNTSLYQYDIY